MMERGLGFGVCFLSKALMEYEAERSPLCEAVNRSSGLNESYLCRPDMPCSQPKVHGIHAYTNAYMHLCIHACTQTCGIMRGCHTAIPVMSHTALHDGALRRHLDTRVNQACCPSRCNTLCGTTFLTTFHAKGQAWCPCTELHCHSLGLQVYK